MTEPDEYDDYTPYDYLGEPIGSCADCGCNLYEGDPPGVCEPCLFREEHHARRGL